MLPHQQNNPSFWQNTKAPEFPPLLEDTSTDICVVGAGIAGLLNSYVLLKNGFQVTILERDTLGHNETSRTSAHLSNVLDEGLSRLLDNLGEENARKAIASHSDAIDLIEKIVAEENIDCDFRRIDGYLYLSHESNKDYLKEEGQAAAKLGFKDVELLASPPYFAEFGPALRFPRQARIHIQKFINGLLQAIVAMGGKVHSQSPAVEFKDGGLPSVKTENGQYVYARHVVVCTNVPVNDRVLVHTMEAAYRTYIIGIEVPHDAFPDILMWDTSHPYHYVRKIENHSEGKDLMLIGGEDHRVGQEDHPESKFETLHDWALFNLGISGPIAYQWSGQIIEPVDGLAHIGRNPGNRNTYIVSGDSGHGLTHAAVGAMVIRDLIQKHPNDWAHIYSPSRFKMKNLGKVISANMNALTQYRDRIMLRDELKNITARPGEGRLVHQGAKTFAVYTNEKNETATLNAVCPHLGGIVHWNEAEKTWDCPCHGSRFACTGEVINGPAISGLKTAVMKKTQEKPASIAMPDERTEYEKAKPRDTSAER
ncbi:FAD-dependent oxidoreductase [Bdellovibrio bacteriovorus]|uniref:FAD-dependent oxidoreductase n=1 Tax=Bdellovibrio bacteriovorus TaxID=959 RepID=UPI0035A5F261